MQGFYARLTFMGSLLLAAALLAAVPNTVSLACGSAKVSFPILSGPKSKSIMVAMLPCGQTVTVLEDESGHPGWLKIRTKAGVTGYLDATLAAGASGASPTQAPLSLPPFPAPPAGPPPTADCRTTPGVMPQLVYRVEPRYSGAARAARRQGTVRLCLTAAEDGTVRDARVVHHLGLGLDENAVEAVRQWRFRPAQRDGQPVGFVVIVDVSFNLLAKPEDSSALESLYREGYTLAAKRDYAGALSSFKVSATRGHADSQFALGKIYTEGLGVSPDYVLAHVWLSLAVGNGSELAATARDVLSGRMTPQQIIAAQTLARKGPPQ